MITIGLERGLMGTNRKYLVAVALLAVLAVVFGLAGTGVPISELSSSSSDSVTRFASTEATYDSGWVNISTKAGQHIPLMHGLNTTDVVVDVTGKQSLDPEEGALAWSRTYGGAGSDYGYSVVETLDGGYALGGRTNSFDAAGYDGWLVKFDSFGAFQWNTTYGGAGTDTGRSVVQTGDGGYVVGGYTNSFDAAGYDGWLVKFDSFGAFQWNTTYGGAGGDYGYSVVETLDGGYALAGYTSSFGAIGWDGWLVKFDSAGTVQWNTTYGGAGGDYGYSVVETLDGGYALAGYTSSFGAIGADGWLVKFDSAGTVQWNTTYGGAGTDTGRSVVQTGDGGYALGGYTDSFDAVGYDGWLVKFDSFGAFQWNTTYGGAGGDYGWSVVQTFDGGYALGGSTESFGAVGYDGWLVKFDSAGTVQWNTTYGGAGGDYGYSVVETLDGGYALGGYTTSFGAVGFDGWLVKVNPVMRRIPIINRSPGWISAYGGSDDDNGQSVVQTLDGGYALGGYTYSFDAVLTDGWLVKFDSAGNMQWSTTYGGAGNDYGWSVVQTFDGGCALAGYTTSFGAVYYDGWLVKFDSAGTVQWNTTYGGAGNDQGYSVVQTGDGGYVVGGYTTSFGAVMGDGWLVKFDSAGTVQWNTTYGGAGSDVGYSVVQTGDGGYALGGRTNSFGAAGWDGWLVKFDSAGTVQWNTTYGGADTDWGYSVVETLDGGYALAGYTTSFGAVGADGWLVKFDSAGTVQWNTTYGGAGTDKGYSVVQTLDGGYVVGGETNSFDAVGYDGWLVKFDSAGTVQWNTTYGGASAEHGFSLVQTLDGGYALGGRSYSWDIYYEGWLIKTDVETGVVCAGLTNHNIILYRGKTDSYWNFVRVRIWLVKEPTWIYGDINQDGIVDIHDLAIVGQNYGQTFSALSLCGIVAVVGIYTYKKREQPT